MTGLFIKMNIDVTADKKFVKLRKDGCKMVIKLSKSDMKLPIGPVRYMHIHSRLFRPGKETLTETHSKLS